VAVYVRPPLVDGHVYVELTEAAELDLADATAWYMERSLELARGFLLEFVRVKEVVQQSPRLWRELEPGFRRALFRRFPYALIYVEEPHRVLVLTVMHQRRDPEAWKSRLALYRDS
jgi:plasmid stabilization system protein ParE